MSKSYIRLDPKALEKIKDLTPFILENEEKDPDSDGVSLHCNLPLEEILLAATTNKLFENAEPTHHGCWRLKKTAYHQPMNADIAQEGKDQAYMHPNDVKQGRNGNCWFLAAIIAILTKPGGDKFISGIMRDMSQKVLINGELISIGKLVGLKNDNVILIRWFEGSYPHYVLVEKSYVNGDFRSKAPAYIQMLEKAYVGYFLNGDFKKAHGGHPEVLFDAFSGGKGGRIIKLDISQKREKFAGEFSNLLNNEIKLPFELLNEIFKNNKDLIETFKKFRTLAGYEDSKKILTPDSVIALAKEAASEIKTKTTKIDLEKLKLVINCLEEYSLCLKSDDAYHPVFAATIEKLLIEISSLPLQTSTSEREAVLTTLRPAIVTFDAEKIKGEQNGGSGEPISVQGFIGKHGFAVSHTGKMILKPSPDSKEIKQYTVVYLVNPWGHTGVVQVYSESQQGLIPVKSRSNVSMVTIDDLIRLGKEIIYEPGVSSVPRHRDNISQNAMMVLRSAYSTGTSHNSSSGLKESGLFSGNPKKTKDCLTTESTSSSTHASGL